MMLKSRIEKLEKLNPIPTCNPYTNWTDKELLLAIKSSDIELQTGRKQEWPGELARKQREASKYRSSFDMLSAE